MVSDANIGVKISPAIGGVKLLLIKFRPSISDLTPEYRF